jgi:Na+-driven multidrug efflux pump
MGTLVMLVSSCLLLLGRNQLGRLFSSEHDVVMLTAQAVPPLAVSLIGEACTWCVELLTAACTHLGCQWASCSFAHR